jgi:hypothetical protein
VPARYNTAADVSDARSADALAMVHERYDDALQEPISRLGGINSNCSRTHSMKF